MSLKSEKTVISWPPLILGRSIFYFQFYALILKAQGNFFNVQMIRISWPPRHPWTFDFLFSILRPNSEGLMYILHYTYNQVCVPHHPWTLKLQKVPVYKPDGRDFKETRNLLHVQQVHREPLLTFKVEVVFSQTNPCVKQLFDFFN